jgi:sugar/nucleoside kinase (ribokinase family)
MDLLAVIADGPATAPKRTIRDFRIAPGGQVATALVASTRLGLKCRYLGVLGDDRWGAEVQRALGAEDVSVTAVVRAGIPSRTAIVLIDRAGQRTVFEHRNPRLALSDGEIAAPEFRSGRLLMLDATDIPAGIRAARAAREAGIPIMIDVDRPSRDAAALDSLLASVDVIMAGADFVPAYTGCQAIGEGLAAIDARFSPALVVATLGSEGSIARCAGREIRTPAHAVNVVDTTGAGDAFRGGFAAAWLKQGGEDLEGLLAYATAAAALNCRQLGAQTGLPGPDEVERLLGM